MCKLGEKKHELHSETWLPFQLCIILKYFITKFLNGDIVEFFL